MTQYLIIVPLLLSFLVPKCEFKEKSNLQPPGYVFGIVWTLLYLLFGKYMTMISNEKNKNMLWILTIVNLAVNLLWTPVFNCYKKIKIAYYIIFFLILLNVSMYTLTENKYTKLLLVPYTIWLFVALLLNYDILKSKNNTIKENKETV